MSRSGDIGRQVAPLVRKGSKNQVTGEGKTSARAMKSVKETQTEESLMEERDERQRAEARRTVQEKTRELKN